MKRIAMLIICLVVMTSCRTIQHQNIPSQKPFMG